MLFRQNLLQKIEFVKTFSSLRDYLNNFAERRHSFEIPSFAMPPKRKASSSKNNESASKKAKNAVPKKTRDPIPDVTQIDFTSSAKTRSGKPWNMKFSSWNVNGLRAWCEKNGHSYITAEYPDIFCLQETKCDKDNIPDDVKIPGYYIYWLSGDKEGYSGTGLYTKKEPLKVSYGIGSKKHDKEGRVITAEFEKFHFVTAYIPNSGRGLPRLPYREEWDADFLEYLKKLDKAKPVILCGDLNVAHEEIDLANPKANANKTAGFTKEEREGFTKLLNAGFIDTYRHLYPNVKGSYSWWSYMNNSRSKNVGWRLDYFVISERLKDSLCDSIIRSQVQGSDHCPVTLLMNL